MLKNLKKNYFLLVSTFLILYFFFNLLSGQRGLISYFEKNQILNNLQKEELLLILENQTYCRYHEEQEKWRWAHPYEFCSSQGSAMKNRNIGTFSDISVYPS